MRMAEEEMGKEDKLCVHMRELSLRALINMEGQRVLVKDLEYDAYD